MEKDKIDRFIDAFRSAMYQEFSVSEEGMVANAPGESGGFSSSSPAKGPTAGYDKVLGKKKRKPTPVGRYGSRKLWLQDLKKNGK